jgi:peptide/nickel transport system substrate-binding protein
MGGGNVEITVSAQTTFATDRNLAEAVVALMEEAGLRVIPNLVADTVLDDLETGGQFDWKIRRGDREYITAVQQTNWLAPIGPRTNPWHRAGTDGTLDLLPFEQEAVDVVNAFLSEPDPAAKAELMKQYQKLHTENVYTAGLTNYPGALIINKRIRNVASGTPILAFQWAEDSAMRERMYVPADLQEDYELHPNTLPGKYGEPPMQ